jgi:large-conductance mechanosensitive channel
MGPRSVSRAAESVDVTAGVGGFLAFFLLALALYFLMRNMNARMRRMQYREEQEAAERAEGTERAEGATAAETANGPGQTPGHGSESVVADDD